MKNNMQKIINIGYWVGVVLIVFISLLSLNQLLNIQYIGKDVPVMNSISVSGKGEAVSIPDIATFSFSVTETAKTVKEAQNKATERINIALSAVKSGGVQDKDIKTNSYNINPHYEYIQASCAQYVCPPGKSVLTGYDVSQTIEVKVRDLTKAGELFDSIGTAGVQNVNGLTFSIDNIDSVKAIARAQAIEDAKMKAQKIADSLGVRIVKIVGFYDSTDEAVYNTRAEMSDIRTMSAKAPTPQIPTGEQKVTANVSITYEIR